jgi:DNA-binding NarL/FixJ family response regulator
MKPEGEIRLVIADDHPVMRDGLKAALSAMHDIVVVGQAADGANAVACFETLRPDVVLMDLRMPGMDGLQAIAAIRRVDPNARIVVLTTYPGDVLVRQAIEAGAMSYLLKTASLDEIIAAIRHAVEGRSDIAREVVGELRRHAADEALTAKELRVLELVASGLKNRQIGEALFISEETVKTRLKNILAKLGASDRTHAVTIATQRGILLT